MTEGMLELLQGLRQGAAEHPDLRRHRLRQDDAAERALALHSGRRAHRHHRGRRRTAAAADARGAHGNAAGQRGRHGRDSHPRNWSSTPSVCVPTASSSARFASEEALDMLQAMNTGHDGSLTTIHANTPRDGLGRLEVMVGMANANMGIRSIRQQIASRRRPVRAGVALQRRHAPHHAHHRSGRHGEDDRSRCRTFSCSRRPASPKPAR